MAQDYGFGINGNGRPLSYQDYKDLTKARQQWINTETGKDPAYQQWLAAQGVTPDTYGQGPAWTGKDYNLAWLDTLSPEVRADYIRHGNDSKDWTDTVGGVLKYAIPLAVGGAGLAATGLLGPAAQGFVGGAPLSSTAAAGAAAPAFETLGGAWGPGYAAVPSSGVPGAAEAASAIAAAGGSGTAAGQALLDAYVNSGPWTGPSMPGPANGTNIPTGAEAGAGTAAGTGLLDAAGNIDWGEVLKTAGSLLNSGDSASSGMGGGDGGLLGYRPYTPPAAPVRAPFKPSTGLADFARALQVARTPKGLMSF
jgi:hypothetical protein